MRDLYQGSTSVVPKCLKIAFGFSRWGFNV
jgi:hypothetical protein